MAEQMEVETVEMMEDGEVPEDEASRRDLSYLMSSITIPDKCDVLTEFFKF